MVHADESCRVRRVMCLGTADSNGPPLQNIPVWPSVKTSEDQS